LLCGRSGTAGKAGIPGYEKGRDFALCSRPTSPQQVRAAGCYSDWLVAVESRGQALLHTSMLLSHI
jgi:hypothetical protein